MPRAAPRPVRACLGHHLQGVPECAVRFQIRDDILDVEGETAVIGKPAGSDQALEKATWPALFGLAESKTHCATLLEGAMRDLDYFGADAEPLRRLARYIVERQL